MGQERSVNEGDTLHRYIPKQQGIPSGNTHNFSQDEVVEMPCEDKVNELNKFPPTACMAYLPGRITPSLLCLTQKVVVEVDFPDGLVTTTERK